MPVIALGDVEIGSLGFLLGEVEHGLGEVESDNLAQVRLGLPAGEG